jgi:hypothetical protein
MGNAMLKCLETLGAPTRSQQGRKAIVGDPRYELAHVSIPLDENVFTICLTF